MAKKGAGKAGGILFLFLFIFIGALGVYQTEGVTRLVTILIVSVVVFFLITNIIKR